MSSGSQADLRLRDLRFRHRDRRGYRLYPQQSAIILIGHGIQQSVRPLTHIAEPLVKFGEHRLATQFLQLGIEYQALDTAGYAGISPRACAGDEIDWPCQAGNLSPV